MVKKLSPAGWSWFGLTIYVISADLYLIAQRQKGKMQFYTMSTAFRDSLSHPIKRWPIILIWTYLTFHLFNFFFPERIRRLDPLSALGAVMLSSKTKDVCNTALRGPASKGFDR